MPIENVPTVEEQKRRLRWVGIGCVFGTFTAYLSHRMIKAVGVPIDHWSIKMLLAVGTGLATYFLVLAIYRLTKKSG